MKIEAVSKASGLNGGPEVWVRVFSNEVLDWPTVEDQLDDGQRVMLENLGRNRVLSYFPHNPTDEEQAEHGYAFEEFWVWAKKGRS